MKINSHFFKLFYLNAIVVLILFSSNSNAQTSPNNQKCNELQTELNSNLLPDGGFENSTSGWSRVTVGTTTYPITNFLNSDEIFCGNKSFEYTGVNGQGNYACNFNNYTTITTVPGQVYTIKCFVKVLQTTTSAPVNILITLSGSSGNAEYNNQLPFSGSYYEYTYSVTASNTLTIGFSFFNNSQFKLDNIIVTEASCTNANIPNNLIINPGFESATQTTLGPNPNGGPYNSNNAAGWQTLWGAGSNISSIPTEATISSTSSCGSNALCITHDNLSSNAWLVGTANPISVIPGQTYTFSADVLMPTVGQQAQMFIAAYNGSTQVSWGGGQYTLNLLSNSSWNRQNLTFTVPSNVNLVYPYFQVYTNPVYSAGTTNGSVYFDNVSLLEDVPSTIGCPNANIPGNLITTNAGFEAGPQGPVGSLNGSNNPNPSLNVPGWQTLWGGSSNITGIPSEATISNNSSCGSNALCITHDNSASNAWLVGTGVPIPVTPGQSYTFSADVYMPTTGQSAQMFVATYNGSTQINWGGGQYSYTLVSNPGWNRQSYTFTIPTGSTINAIYPYFQVYTNPVYAAGTTNGSVYFDNVAVTNNCSIAGNLISVNPGFENAPQGTVGTQNPGSNNPGPSLNVLGWQTLWGGTSNITNTPTEATISSTSSCGSNSLCITHDGSSSWWLLGTGVPITVNPGQSYTFSADVLMPTSGQQAQMFIATYNGSTQVSWGGSQYTLSLVPCSTWTRQSFTFSIPSGVNNIYPYFQIYSSGSVYFDNVSVTPAACAMPINNIINNSGFEGNSLAGWVGSGTGTTFTVTNQQAYCGTYSLNINVGNNTGLWDLEYSTDIPVTPGQRYQFTAAIQSNVNIIDFNGYIRFAVAGCTSTSLPCNVYDAFNMVNENIEASAGYALYEFSFVIPPNIHFIQPRIEGAFPGSGNSIYVDNIGLYLQDEVAINPCPNSNITNNLITTNSGFEDAPRGTVGTQNPGSNNPGPSLNVPGWQTLWGGTSNITSNSKEATISGTSSCGINSLCITHDGSSSWWLLGTSYNIPVTPGQTYTLSADFLYQNSSTTQPQMFVSTFDGSNNVITWGLATINIPTGNNWNRQSLTFTVPTTGTTVYSIVPYFQVYNQGAIYIDNVTLVNTATSPSATPFSGVTPLSITNSANTLTVSFDPTVNSITFTDSRIPKTYVTNPLQQYTFYGAYISQTTGDMILQGYYLDPVDSVSTAVSIDIGFVSVPGTSCTSVKFQLSGDFTTEYTNWWSNSSYGAFPAGIPTSSSDYFIVPVGTGIITPSTYGFNDGAHFYSGVVNFSALSMPFVGVVNNPGTYSSSGYMIVGETPWDMVANFTQSANTGLYNVAVSHLPSKGTLGYTRSYYYVFENSNGYVGLTNWYKNYVQEKGSLGPYLTFSQKVAGTSAIPANSNINKLAGAADFWYQSLNYCGDVSFINDIQNMGIDRAIYSNTNSVDNNVTDYSFLTFDTWSPPQYRFAPLNDPSTNQPVPSYAANNGFLAGRYDTYNDIWLNHMSDDKANVRTIGAPSNLMGGPNDLIYDLYQNPIPSWRPENGNQAYACCSQMYSQFASTWITSDLSFNPGFNCRFIDVISSSGMMECYNSSHPTTTTQDARYRYNFMNSLKTSWNFVTGAENGKDYFFPVIDYNEGLMTIFGNADVCWQNSVSTSELMSANSSTTLAYENYTMSPIQRLPLHGLIYHNVNIPTWHTGDGTSKITDRWDRKIAFTALYGTIPLLMPDNPQIGSTTCNSNFINNDDNEWYTNIGQFMSTYHLTSMLHRCIFNANMTNHTGVLTNNQTTTFDNGWSVTANFASSTTNVTTISGTSLPTYMDVFSASDGTGNTNISRSVSGSGFLDIAYLNNSYGQRLFINPNGGIGGKPGTNTTNFMGVGTKNAVYLELKNPGVFTGPNQQYIHFSAIELLQGQTTIDIYPEQLPWPLCDDDKFNVYAENGVACKITKNVGYVTCSLKVQASGNTKPAGKNFQITGNFLASGNTCTATFRQSTDSLNNTPQEHISIYPNPTTSKVTVSLSYPVQMQNVTVSVVNMLGNEIYSGTLGSVTTESYTIDLSNQAPGVYIVKILADGEASYHKVILSE